MAFEDPISIPEREGGRAFLLKIEGVWITVEKINSWFFW